jgi:hypothetical protein
MTINVNGVISAGPETGTFSGIPGGSFLWSEGTKVYSGGLRSGGDIAVSGVTAAGQSPALIVDVRKGGGAFDNSSLAGTYFNVGYAWQPAASPYHYTISGLLTFDGVGGWTTTMDGNREGLLVTGATNTGTYSIAADGSASLSDPGTVFLGTVLFGGELLVLGTFGSGARVEIVLCARKGGTFTQSSMQGDYWVVGFGSNPVGHDHFSSSGSCAFDGTGSLTWTGSQNAEGTITSLNGMTETYAIASDGTLTLVNSGIGSGLTLRGGVVAGGALALVSAVTNGNRLETRMFIKK